MEQFIDSDYLPSRSINLKRLEDHLKTVENKHLEEHIADGWIPVPSRLKKSTRLRKNKEHHVLFKDRVWALFAKLGIKYLNKGDNFKLYYTESCSEIIDVFAIDKEVILFIFCMSLNKRAQVSCQDTIDKIVLRSNELRNSAQKILPGKQKVAFIFATNNCLLNENDMKRLDEGNISHFNQDDVEYFEQLADHMGSAARYQLYGKLFEGQKIPELENKIPAIKAKMATGITFYSFSVDPEYLLKIGYVLHRSDISSDVVSAYQRLIKKNKLSVISKYINAGGYFPNSIILNIRTKNNKELKFDTAKSSSYDTATKLGILNLPKTYRSAFIIDGQHRLYGYAFKKSTKKHTIPVVAFHNLSSEEQTRIFIDINNTQNKVPRNLLHSIMSDFHWESDDRNAALSALITRMFIEMTHDEYSPFYKRIILTEEKKTTTRCLTLDTIKSWSFARANYFGKAKNYDDSDDGHLWTSDYKKTLEKAKAFFNTIFSYVEKELHGQWNLGISEGGFIGMNIGVSSIIRTCDSVLSYLVSKKSLKPKDFTGENLAIKTIEYLHPVVEFVNEFNYDQLKKFRSFFGGTAPEKVLREFQFVIHEQFKEFNPDGLEQWIRDNSGEYNDPSYDLGHNRIEPLIDKFIKKQLQAEFGEDNWWFEGVPSEVQKKCAGRRIDEKSNEPDDNFLNTIDYLDIVNHNWNLLGNSFTMPGTESKNKKMKISWFVKLNKIRQKYSHPQRERVCN